MAKKKAAAKPAVTRGPDGRAVSAKPPVQPPGPTSGFPTFVGKTKDKNFVASRPTKKRKTTRSGKKLTAEGTVAVPTVTRDETGKLRGTSKEERAAAVTTELPDAPVVREETPVSGNIGRVSTRATGVSKAGSVPALKALVATARGHLQNMQDTHGTPDFHGHHSAFNEVHATIMAGDHQLGTMLGIARHAVVNPTPESANHLTLAHTMIDERLRGAETVESGRASDNARNSANRKARIEAYKVDRNE
jgi:hypothetical protein